MEIKKIYEITFDTDDALVAATLSKANEIVMLLSSGDVARFNLDKQEGEYLFSAKSTIGYHDEGFDTTAKSSIYTLDEIVVVVNDFKTHGYVHYPGNYHKLHLWRKDNYANISNYPIALYKNETGIPHLIYGEDWNHVQIMNLDTRQILTATKSLIEENAEESHIEFYKKHTEDNKLAWPSRYDYFYGKLYLSPNKKNFLSAGWSWGSCDCYNIYDIEKFISSNRISYSTIGAWEHETRVTCWIDDETVAVVYDPFIQGDDDATKDSLHEIHFIKIDSDKTDVDRIVKIEDKSVLRSKMYYSNIFRYFVVLSEETGLSIISLDGQIIFKDENLKANEYNAYLDLLLEMKDKTIKVYKIVP